MARKVKRLTSVEDIDLVNSGRLKPTSCSGLEQGGPRRKVVARDLVLLSEGGPKESLGDREYSY